MRSSTTTTSAESQHQLLQQLLHEARVLSSIKADIPNAWNILHDEISRIKSVVSPEQHLTSSDLTQVLTSASSATSTATNNSSTVPPPPPGPGPAPAPAPAPAPPPLDNKPQPPLATTQLMSNNINNSANEPAPNNANNLNYNQNLHNNDNINSNDISNTIDNISKTMDDHQVQSTAPNNLSLLIDDDSAGSNNLDKVALPNDQHSYTNGHNNNINVNNEDSHNEHSLNVNSDSINSISENNDAPATTTSNDKSDDLENNTFTSQETSNDESDKTSDPSEDVPNEPSQPASSTTTSASTTTTISSTPSTTSKRFIDTSASVPLPSSTTPTLSGLMKPSPIIITTSASLSSANLSALSTPTTSMPITSSISSSTPGLIIPPPPPPLPAPPPGTSSTSNSLSSSNPTVTAAAVAAVNAFADASHPPPPVTPRHPIRKRVKLKVPADQYPDYNFVGRLLGPRGATLKRLERDTACRIMIRGKGSIRKDKEAEVRGKPGYEHVFHEPLHVVIEVADATDDASATRTLQRAKELVEMLLVPVPEERDSLKRAQLRDLAILNGTHRSVSDILGAPPPPPPPSAPPPTLQHHNHNHTPNTPQAPPPTAQVQVSGPLLQASTSMALHHHLTNLGNVGVPPIRSPPPVSSPPPQLRRAHSSMNNHGAATASLYTSSDAFAAAFDHGHHPHNTPGSSFSRLPMPSTSSGATNSFSASNGFASSSNPAASADSFLRDLPKIRIPSLDLDALNDPPPLSSPLPLPAASPTLVDPDYYPYPPTPSILSVDQHGTSSLSAFASPLWSNNTRSTAPSAANFNPPPRSPPAGRSLPPRSPPPNSNAKPAFMRHHAPLPANMSTGKLSLTDDDLAAFSAKLQQQHLYHQQQQHHHHHAMVNRGSNANSNAPSPPPASPPPLDGGGPPPFASADALLSLFPVDNVKSSPPNNTQQQQQQASDAPST